MGCRLAAYVDELAVAVVRSDAVLHKAAEDGAVGRQDSKCQVIPTTPDRSRVYAAGNETVPAMVPS